MSEDLVPYETRTPASTVQLGILKGNDADALVESASNIASRLARIVEDSHLYTIISRKKYVHVEGWTTLAAMLGSVPREISNLELSDGSFEAKVEVVRISDGQIMTEASALCGTDEPTWKNRPKYARRSMAATRATSKACRLAFSWIMVLAGYEPTPAEEMDFANSQKSSQPESDESVRCPECGDAMVLKPTGTTKAGKSYKAFYYCSNAKYDPKTRKSTGCDGKRWADGTDAGKKKGPGRPKKSDLPSEAEINDLLSGSMDVGPDRDDIPF